MKPSDVAAHNLRRMRMARGLTQQVLADASGVGRSMLAKIESGNRLMSIDDLVALALVLDVSVLTLLDPDAEIIIKGAK